VSTEPRCCRDYGHATLAGTWQNLIADIDRHLSMTPESAAKRKTFKRRLNSFFRPEIQSLFLYRVSHFLYQRRWERVARLISSVNFHLHKIRISPQSCIGPGCRLPHPPGVMFHGRAGEGLTVYSLAICTTTPSCLEGPLERGPILGDGVVLGAHCVIIGDVNVGNGSKVAFAVRVSSDVPAYGIAMSQVVRTHQARSRDL